MELQFLGTGAADTLPSLDDVDRFIQDINIRRYTAGLLNQKILLDCGPHVPDAITLFEVDGAAIEHIIITHEHGDHFDSNSIKAVAGLAHRPIELWLHEGITPPEIDGVLCHPMKVGKTYQIGGLAVTALAANHHQNALHFSIEDGEKKLFYGLDGAWVLTPTYYYMKEKAYDCMVIDATLGESIGDYRISEHNSLPMLRMMEKSFRTDHVLKPDSKFVMAHMARTLYGTHQEICDAVKDDGYLVSYDGMKLTI